jgi:hypothetical protein
MSKFKSLYSLASFSSSQGLFPDALHPIRAELTAVPAIRRSPKT